MIIGLMVAVLVEALLMGFWNRSYFSWGLPLFKQRIQVPAASLSHLPFNWLEGDYPPASWARIVFEPLAESTCAFRETLLMPRGPGYVPVMRGLIVADRRKSEIQIVGRCNWSILLVAAILVSALTAKPAATLVTAGLLVGSYFVQRRRFQNVATAVRAMVHANPPPRTGEHPLGPAPDRY